MCVKCGKLHEWHWFWKVCVCASFLLLPVYVCVSAATGQFAQGRLVAVVDRRPHKHSWAAFSLYFRLMDTDDDKHQPAFGDGRCCSYATGKSEGLQHQKQLEDILARNCSWLTRFHNQTSGTTSVPQRCGPSTVLFAAETHTNNASDFFSNNCWDMLPVQKMWLQSSGTCESMDELILHVLALTACLVSQILLACLLMIPARSIIDPEDERSQSRDCCCTCASHILWTHSQRAWCTRELGCGRPGLPCGCWRCDYRTPLPSPSPSARQARRLERRERRESREPREMDANERKQLRVWGAQADAEADDLAVYTALPVVIALNADQDADAVATVVEQEVQTAMQTCIICQQAPRATYFRPCGHVIACARCADELVTRAAPAAPKCPTCRQLISQLRAAYL